MGLGSTFWSNSGLAALWHDLTDLRQGVIYGSANGVRPLDIGCCKIYQEAMGDGGDGDLVQKNPGYNSGYFYMVETSTGENTWTNGVWLYGTAHRATSGRGQWVLLGPSPKIGDIVPAILPSVANAQFPQGPLYKTGFLQNYDVGRAPYNDGTNNLTLRVRTNANIPGDWMLYHYSPYAWSGTPPEVVASAAMHAGIDDDYIDQDAFDSAHDAYDLSTGDSPWTDLDYKWTIHARRVVGTKVADFLMDCINHSRDLIYVNESGKLSVSSWTNPLNTVTGFSLVGDQVIDVLSHNVSIKHTFNSVNAGWGSANSQSWGVPNAGSGGPLYNEITASEDPQLESKFVDKWRHEDEDSDSIKRYGTMWLKGKKAIVAFKGQPQAVETSHYPYLLTPHVDLGYPGYDWEPADGGGMIHVTHWLTSDAKSRAEITIRQGPMGFDMGIGDLITDLEITGDGRTIAEARVIERTYNFDSMTIDSVIMEIPPNT